MSIMASDETRRYLQRFEATNKIKYKADLKEIFTQPKVRMGVTPEFENFVMNPLHL